MTRWPLFVPVVAVALLVVALLFPGVAILTVLSGVVLIAAVLAAVHHAEVVALRLGEPLGTLVLALAVTIIEAALILSMMLVGGPSKAPLARDSIFAAVMIICNGVVGLCMLLGGLRYREQVFRVEGAGPSLAGLAALGTLSLVLPSFTTSSPGQSYSPAQLAFAGLSSLALWGVFVFAQTVSHRDYFLPLGESTKAVAHAPRPTA